jgi:adenosylcobinamide-phosphate synthase
MTMDALLAPAPLWLLGTAVALELRFGWPRLVPHPVRLIGLILNRLEPVARAFANVRLGGAFALAATLLLTGAACAGLLRIPWAGPAAGAGLAVSGLALGELLRAGQEALRALNDAPSAHDPERARRLVGQLVSRDTADMDSAELGRALAESLAENFNDAFVAPLFWLLLTGPVGLWLYKVVSTMDSMWGYRTPRWEALGMAGARADDLLAWLPARISAALLWLAAPDRSAWPGWKIVRTQAGRMASPNAGWPMAAAAWLHRTGMGGPTPYFGRMCDKPRLGPPVGSKDGQAPWDGARLQSLLVHIRRAGILGAVSGGIAVVAL